MFGNRPISAVCGAPARGRISESLPPPGAGAPDPGPVWGFHFHLFTSAVVQDTDQICSAALRRGRCRRNKFRRLAKNAFRHAYNSVTRHGRVRRDGQRYADIRVFCRGGDFDLYADVAGL